MEKLIQIPDWLFNAPLLIDTNFFIDAYKNEKVYGPFIKVLKDSETALVSINMVKYEFVRSRTIDVVQRKLEFFNKIVDDVLPFDPKIDELVIGTIEEYRDHMEGLPLTDLILATYLRRYYKLYLLTRDHNDFPTNLFTREYIFNIPDFREKIYAIYSYKPKKTIIHDDIPF